MNMKKNLISQLGLIILFAGLLACQKEASNRQTTHSGSPDATRQLLIGHWQTTIATATTTRTIGGKETSSTQSLGLPPSTWDFDGIGNIRVKDATTTELISYTLPDRGTIVLNFRNTSHAMSVSFDKNDMILTQATRMKDGSTITEEVHLTK